MGVAGRQTEQYREETEGEGRRSENGSGRGGK